MPTAPGRQWLPLKPQHKLSEPRGADSFFVSVVPIATARLRRDRRRRPEIQASPRLISAATTVRRQGLRIGCWSRLAPLGPPAIGSPPFNTPHPFRSDCTMSAALSLTGDRASRRCLSAARRLATDDSSIRLQVGSSTASIRRRKGPDQGCQRFGCRPARLGQGGENQELAQTCSNELPTQLIDLL